MPKPKKCTTSFTPSLSDGYFPPPWNFYEHVDKTEGWIAFQQAQRDDPKYYLPSLWISVKDRLPDLYTFVLVFELIKDQPSPMSIARWEGDRWNGLGDQEDGCEYNAFWSDLFWGIDWANITHWMPLPEPPK